MGQEAEPAWFYVYRNDGSGQVNYESPVGKVKYNGRYFHFYETEPLEAGKTYQFGVRAVTNEGVDDSNTAVIGATVDLTGPASVAMVQVGRRM